MINKTLKTRKQLKRKTPLSSSSKNSKVESTKKKGSKKDSKSKLIEKLDRIFSTYIRIKYADSRGNCRCISCGKVHHWKDIQNGHYMSRRYLSTRWSEDNCRPQCVACNIFNQGFIQAYRISLVKEIGEQRVRLIEARALQETCKYGTFELNAMIKHYSKEVERLAKEKGIEV